LHYPELRAQLRSHPGEHLFPDSRLAAILEEICEMTESSGSLEVAISSKLDEQQRGWLSGMMVGSPMENGAKAVTMMGDLLATLNERKRWREVAQFRRAASTANDSEAVAAAQAVIETRRRAARMSP
jgi:hypothetical protein